MGVPHPLNPFHNGLTLAEARVGDLNKEKTLDQYSMPQKNQFLSANSFVNAVHHRRLSVQGKQNVKHIPILWYNTKSAEVDPGSSHLL